MRDYEKIQDMLNRETQEKFVQAWQDLQKMKFIDENYFAELSVRKAKVLVGYCIGSVALTIFTLAIAHRVSIFLLLNTVFSLHLFLLWKRFYNYRVEFQDSMCVSAYGAAEKLHYPKFLVSMDFLTFARFKCFCKDATYNHKTGVLQWQWMPKNFNEAAKKGTTEVADEVNILLDHLVERLQGVQSKAGSKSLKNSVDQFIAVLKQIDTAKLDGQFGRHLVNYYLIPLSELLQSEQEFPLDGVVQQDFIDLLQFLTRTLQDLMVVESVSDTNDFSTGIKAMLQMSKIDGSEW